jgi:alkylation response protein AidB-like acyl-CoA dehydrogenase
VKLDFSQEEASLGDAIARIASDHLSADASVDLSPAFWAAFKEAGWLALPFPEALGGAGSTLVGCGIVLEEMGRHGLTTPFLSGWVVAGRLLARATQSERVEWFDGLITGTLSMALAHAEQCQFDPRELKTLAVRDGAGWWVEGSKRTVLGGADATHIIVTASCNEHSLLLALLPTDAPGLQVRRFQTWRGESAADFEIACRIAPEHVLASGEAARVLLDDALREAVVASCWEAVGMMRTLIDDTIKHVKTRHQFGKAMSALQVVRHRVAEMSVYYEETRALIRGATLQAERGECNRVVAAAKYKTSEAARYISRQAVQLHGGVGVTAESRVALLFRKLMAFESLYGDSTEHVCRYGDAVIESRSHTESAVLP